MRRSIVTLLSALLHLGSGLATAAETLEHAGNFDDWDVFVYEPGGKRICYAATAATSFSPRIAGRGQPYLYVSRYPGVNKDNKIEVRFGFDAGVFPGPVARVIARAKLEKDTFSLSANQDAGIVTNETELPRLLASMEKGREIVIVSEPGKGAVLEDRYSLYGVTDAVKTIEAACP